ncbi:hypothetical protein HDU81_005999 [Chytriomyces hyalinus]|nr:hypothetical protein HDU81_005999 [Chytriomyces hyalinus]
MSAAASKTTTTTTTTTSINTNASTLEKLWLGSQAVSASLVGIANMIAPFDIMSTRIERSKLVAITIDPCASHISNATSLLFGNKSGGGGSIQTLFDSTLKAVEAAESAAKNASLAASAPASANSSNPYAAAVGSSLNAMSSTSPQALAQERLSIARENVDTLAALVASTLFQVQYAVGGDALVAYLGFVGLTTSSHAERRFIHQCLGIVKATQYAVYLLHESATSGGLSVFNLGGLIVSISAAYVWGFKKPAVAAATSTTTKPAATAASTTSTTSTTAPSKPSGAYTPL